MLQERDDIVALDSAIIQHPRTWEASGHLAGFTDPLIDCRTCKLRFRADHLERARVRPQAVEAARRDPGLRPHRGAGLQPDVRDHGRAGQGGGLEPCTCARRPRRGSSSTSRTTSSSPQEAAVRDRPDRQELPQRDHARQLHLPDARVRADGDGVLRRRRTRPIGGSSTGSSERLNWYMRLGIRPDHLRLRPHDADELSHYSSATSDVEYLFPGGLVGARGDRQPRRLRLCASTPSARARSSSTSTRRAASATSRT